MVMAKSSKQSRKNIQSIRLKTVTSFSERNNFVVLLVFSLYMFIIFGMIFHTSAHPQILGKYTLKYLLVLFSFCLFAPVIFMIIYKLFQKISRKKFLVAIAIFLLVPLSIVEGYLRMKYKNYESTHYRVTLDNYHPFLQSQPASSDPIHINSLGFRGEEIERKKPDNTFRIVVLGGSTVLNREVSFEYNAVRLLEKKLRSHYPQKRIEVINAGQSGYTTEHSLIQYLFKVRDLDPDMVIMWHGINDMWVSCPTEGITHGSYKSDYSHTYGLTANIVFDYFRPQPFIQIKVLTLDFLVKALRDNLYSDFTQKMSAQVSKQRAIQYKENKGTISVRDFPSIDAYKRNITYLIDVTKKDEIPLLLGNQANLFHDNPTVSEVERIMYPTLVCHKDNKYYDLASLQYGIDLFNIATEELSSQNDVDFVDFDSQIPKNLSYYSDNVHYTEKGNEVIADMLFKKIVQGNYIE